MRPALAADFEPEILKRISVHLVRLGWTQAELCRQSGVKTAKISLWRARRQVPDEKTLKRIAEALGVSFVELVAGLHRCNGRIWEGP